MGFQWIPTIPTWMFMALVDSDIYHLLSELRYIYIISNVPSYINIYTGIIIIDVLFLLVDS